MVRSSVLLLTSDVLQNAINGMIGQGKISCQKIDGVSNEGTRQESRLL